MQPDQDRVGLIIGLEGKRYMARTDGTGSSDGLVISPYHQGLNVDLQRTPFAWARTDAIDPKRTVTES